MRGRHSITDTQIKLSPAVVCVQWHQGAAECTWVDHQWCLKGGPPGIYERVPIGQIVILYMVNDIIQQVPT